MDVDYKLNSSLHLNRRHVFQGLLGIFMSGSLAGCGNTEGLATAVSDETDIWQTTERNGFLDEIELGFIASVSEAIIPTTSSPGAIKAGVPQTLQALLTDWAHEGFKTFWLRELVNLSDRLAQDSGIPFVDRPTHEQSRIVAEHDKRVFTGEIKDQFYRDLKRAVVEAYYLSEIGASRELVYLDIPGDWRGCVPLSEQPVTWAI